MMNNDIYNIGLEARATNGMEADFRLPQVPERIKRASVPFLRTGIIAINGLQRLLQSDIPLPTLAKSDLASKGIQSNNLDDMYAFKEDNWGI